MMKGIDMIVKHHNPARQGSNPPALLVTPLVRFGVDNALCVIARRNAFNGLLGPWRATRARSWTW